MGFLLLVLGALCVVYGVSIMLIWSGSAFFAVWYIIGGLLAGAGALIRTGVWQRFAVGVRWSVGACALIALAGVLVLSARIMGASAAVPPAKLDYLIVLGAQVREDWEPSVSLRYRLERARGYLLENPDTCCVVSGGQGPNEPCTEAEAMASWLERNGIAPERIIREDRSTNTVENIRYSRDAIEREDPGAAATARIGIVTNDFHLYRATGLALKQGLRGAVGVPAASNPFYLPNNVLRECFGVVKDLLAGNM